MASARSRVIKIGLVVLAFFATAAIISLVVVLTRDSSSSNLTGSRVTKDLKLVIVVSRHGNRASFGDYPTDKYPFNDTKFWPYGSMELTPNGRAQMFSLGAKVRSLYDGFLDSTYYPDDFYAASTASDRVIMSGDMFLAGLYPPGGHQVWYKDVHWQPVTLYSSSLDNTVSVLGTGCPAFTVAANAGKAEFAETYASNISTLNKIVSLETGVSQTGTTPLYILWDKLTSEKIEGYTDIPVWTDSIYPEPLQDLIGQEYIAMFANTDEMVRLTVGNFFENILEMMEGKISGSLSQRMYYYSGHDTSLLGLQIILGISRQSMINLVWPASAMVFELHQNSTTSMYELQVLYIDGSSKDLEPISIPVPNCGDPCEYYSVVSNSKSFTGVDFNKECEVPVTTPNPATTTKTTNI